jgi:hypothetical protein
MAKKKKTGKSKGETQTGMGGFRGDRLSRLTTPPELEDPANRKRWGLAEKAEDRGPYMVELNVQYVDGLAGAATAFVQLFKRAVGAPDPGQPDPWRSALVGSPSGGRWPRVGTGKPRHSLIARSH